MISTVTSKGQITIPVDVRRATGLETGMQVEFIVNTRQRIELVPRHGDIRLLRGAVTASPARAETPAAPGNPEPERTGAERPALHPVKLPPRAG